MNVVALPVSVWLVDDEPDVTAALAWLLDSVGIASRSFFSGMAFLDALPEMCGPTCGVIDLRMPEMSGLEVQQKLAEDGIDLPLMFLTAHGDIAAAVNAMQAGAVDFIQKPFNPEAFLLGINRSIRMARERYARLIELRDLEARLTKLSPREAEVLDSLVSGDTSKDIARLLAISPKTVDIHRANVMRKMMVNSRPELMRLMASSKRLRTTRS